jgi:hypothetical protein
MTWGTDFTTGIFLSRQDYNKNPLLVKDSINEKDLEISNIKIKLAMLVGATPNTIVNEEWKDDILNGITNELVLLLNELEELLIDKYKLGLYLEYLEDK